MDGWMEVINQLIIMICVNVSCIFFLSEASIPEEFFSLFANQTHLISAIYNYTTLIPQLELLVREMTPSLPPSQIQNEQNATQNCTNTQNASAVPEVPACPIGIEAPGKLLILK